MLQNTHTFNIYHHNFTTPYYQILSLSSKLNQPSLSLCMSSQTPSSNFPIDDVLDFSPEGNGEVSVPWDRFNHVCGLMEKGTKAYRENQYEEAISCYSKANRIKPGDPIILGNRCTAYLKVSEFLKHRPASASEYTPLHGFDPTILAELALKDAEKLMNLESSSVKSCRLKATALVLLERYEMARDAILSGLQVDPFSTPLQASLQDLEKITDGLKGRRSHGKAERTDDFDCTLCYKLLYEPITTPCGHTFCRSCLFQCMDRGNKCPLCRTVVYITPRACSISVILNNIIQKNFPEEYAERKSENDGLKNFGANLIPLFVMDVVIPCQKFPLHIFEPRYRLMIRRIMEGNRRMGMVVIDSSTGIIADVGCEVEIIECEPLPDGRFYIEIESRRRFRIIQSWDQDGYRVAEVQWFQDECVPEGTREKPDLQELTVKAAQYAQSWIRKAKEAALHDRSRLEKLLNHEVMMPTLKDPELFSFWLTTLTDRMPSERLDLLRLTDTKERIRRGLIFLKSQEDGCRVQ